MFHITSDYEEKGLSTVLEFTQSVHPPSVICNKWKGSDIVKYRLGDSEIFNDQKGLSSVPYTFFIFLKFIPNYNPLDFPLHLRSLLVYRGISELS